MTGAPVHTAASPYIFTIIINFFRALGLDVVTIDGSILPGTYIVFMFVAWGVWHWILMAINSYGALPRIYGKIKEMIYARNSR